MKKSKTEKRIKLKEHSNDTKDDNELSTDKINRIVRKFEKNARKDPRNLPALDLMFGVHERSMFR